MPGIAKKKVSGKWVDIGRRIAAARSDAGLTQRELGDIVGREAISISRLERGETRAGLELTRKLAAALKRHPAWIDHGVSPAVEERAPGILGELRAKLEAATPEQQQKVLKMMEVLGFRRPLARVAGTTARKVA